MIASAALIATVFEVALAYYFMDQFTFLIPYRIFMFQRYGFGIAIYAVLLWVNLFACAFLLMKKFLLKDTGQKLLHMDKQIRAGHSDLSPEVAQQFMEHE